MIYLNTSITVSCENISTWSRPQPAGSLALMYCECRDTRIINRSDGANSAKLTKQNAPF